MASEKGGSRGKQGEGEHPVKTLPTRALTLYQPWAWLVASGLKPIENRPRSFVHKSFRGEFWIHAGLGPTKKIERENTWQHARELCRFHLGKDFELPTPEELDYGKIIGRARATDILHPIGTLLFKPDVPWHFPEEYGFVLADARLVTPVKSRGYQGFWSVPEGVLERLAA